MNDAPESAEERAALEAGRLLFAGDCTFLRSAADETALPDLGAAEVAFAGRSNVGKSSLLNALTGRKTLARASNTPGRTRLLNFFDLGGRLVLVDLPGYGYARASKTDIARWTQLTRGYLKGRPQLRRVCGCAAGCLATAASVAATMRFRGPGFTLSALVSTIW